MDNDFNSKLNIQNSTLPSTQLTVQGFPVRTSGPSFLPRSIQALQSVGDWQYAQIGGSDLWLRMEIAIAFKQFLCMKLAKPPVAEEIPFTAESWLIAIADGMTEALDRERIKQGFKQLYRTLKWWPQPAELLNILPRRQQPPPSHKAAEEADIDTSADGEKLQDILDQLERKEREANHGA